MLVIGIGASVVFVRYLGEKSYGVAIYITDISLMAVILCSLGLGTFQAMQLPKLKAENRLPEYRYLIIHNIKLRLSFLCTFVIAIRLGTWSGVFDFLKIDDQFYYFLCLFAFLQLVLAFFRGPLQIEYQQKFLNSMDVSFLIGRLLLFLPVIYFDLGLIGFLWTEVIVEVGQMVLLSLRFKKLVWDKLKGVSSIKYSGDILKTSIPLFIVDFSSKFFGKETDIIFIGMLLGASGFADITAYSLCYVLVVRSYSFLGLGTSNAATLLMNSASEIVSTGNSHLLKSLIEKQFRLLALLIIPIATGGIILGEVVLTLLYGKIFEGKGIVSGIIFFGIGITSISYIARPILFVFEKEKLLVKQRCIVALLKVILFVSVVPFLGLTGVASVSIFTVVLISLLEMRLLSTLIKLDIPWFFIFKSLIGSLVMAFFVLLIKHYIGHISFLKLLTLAFSGAITYLLTLLVLKPFNQNDCDALRDIKVFGVIDAGRFISFFSKKGI